MKKNKITIMQGLPGSGKSTKSNEILNANLSGIKTLRLNRDSLRKMLWPQNLWTPEFEEIIVEIETVLAKFILKKKIDVIIDDTNLAQETIDKWIKLSSNNEIVDFSHVPIELCILRDQKRIENGGNYIGPEVILKLARKHDLLK